MASKVSFKSMQREGVIKRADARQVRYEDIHIEPGFNPQGRNEGQDEDDESLFLHIMDGGMLPPLEVRPRAEGGVWIVDGHRRYTQIGRADKAGAPLRDKDGNLWIDIVPFEGNDVDRNYRILTSAERKELTPLQVAEMYARLVRFKQTPAEIAERLKPKRTRQHVEQMLILAHANADVHELVRSGAVSASVAIEAVRKHGENAGAFLAGKQDEAQAAGKSRITAQTIKGKPLPRALVEKLESAIAEAVECLPSKTVQSLEELRTKHEGRVPEDVQAVIPAWVLLNLLDDHAAIVAERQKQEQRARDKAAKAAQTTIEGA